MQAFRHFAAPVAALCIGVGVVGCSSEPRAEQVPPNAQLLVQGDQMLNYTATQDGTVYVYDASDNTLLYSGDIKRNQSVSIDPDKDKVMIDGKLALEKDIHAGNRHRIYFVPDPDAVASDRQVIERTTEIREQPAGDRVIVTPAPADSSSTTIKREETKKIDTGADGDVTVKKETTIMSE